MAEPTTLETFVFNSWAGPAFGAHEPGDRFVVVVGADNNAADPPLVWSVIGDPDSSYGHPAPVFTQIGQIYCPHAPDTRRQILTAFIAEADFAAPELEIATFGDALQVLTGFLAMWLVRGAATNPPDAVDASCGPGTTSASISIPGVATSVDEALILTMFAGSRAGASINTDPAVVTDWTNPSLAGFAEGDYEGASGLRNIGAASGVLASAGASGTTTATNSRLFLYSYVTIALRPGRTSAPSWGPGMIRWA